MIRQAAVSSCVAFEDYFEREASCGADAPRHEWFGPGESIRIHGAIVEVDRVYRA